MRAQSAIESAIIISVMFSILVVFLVLLTRQGAEAQEKQDARLIADIAFIIKTEAELAAQVEDGYTRNFELVQSLRGRNYEVQLLPSSLLGGNTSEAVVEYSEGKKHRHVESLPQGMSGTLQKGNNLIRKNQGTVCFNTATCP